jgi:NAD-dependent deacetylase
MSTELEKAAEIIKNSKNMIALTGAGISVESGIPDFRSSGGLWDKYDPAIYASIYSFKNMPEKVWEMIFELMEITGKAEPNPGHIALAELEKMGYLKAVITQNIDNLHQEGGSSNVIEYHGNANKLECLKCGHEFPPEDFNIDKKEIPICPDCERILKPSVVFFGEMIPQNALYESQKYAEKADVVLVVGTSAIVYPAAGIPAIASGNGAKIIEFNLEETELTHDITDVFVKGSAGKTLSALVELLKK